jgi:hypothetical protein
MAFHGRVQNGVVVLDDAVSLPEGSIVEVELVKPPNDLQTLRNGLRDLAGTVHGLPEDLAENHDHYSHGAPLQ